jgi:hypothetical protein
LLNQDDGVGVGLELWIGALLDPLRDGRGLRG